MNGAKVIVPTVVIAEATTGDHRWDANVNLTLLASVKGVTHVVAVSELD